VGVVSYTDHRLHPAPKTDFLRKVSREKTETMKSFTQSAIAAKSIDEFNSDGSFIENLKSLLIYLALLIYVANALNIPSLFDKLSKYTRRQPLASIQDKPIHRRRSVLESTQDKPFHKRRKTLVLTQDAPTSRRTSDSQSSTTNDTMNNSTEESAFDSFCQENREYVKNWKEERVNRQLFEMWHELGEEGQKEWVNKAEALDKLFEATDKTKVYKSIVKPKLRKTDAALCKQITGCESALYYFQTKTNPFQSFFMQYAGKDPYKPPTVDINTWTSKVCLDTNYTKKVLAEWIKDGGDERQKTRYTILTVNPVVGQVHQRASYVNFNLWTDIGPEGRKLWEDAYDSMVHAYELFCQNVRRTDPEMSDNVDEHLSRMWESLEEDDKTSNTGYAYFCGCNRDTTKPEMNLSQMWKSLSKAERKKWATSAELL